MIKELDFTGLAQFLLGRSRELVGSWLPAGKLKGKEYSLGNINGNEGRSLSINIDTGLWSDFNTKEGGRDLISLYAAIHNIGQGEAAKSLANDFGYDLGSNTPKPQRAVASFVIAPPPELDVPNMEKPSLGVLSHYWTYRDDKGFPLFYFARYDGKDGKTFLPWCYIGNNQWATRGWPPPRPLYGLELLASRPNDPVMIVEGEKTAEAARVIAGQYYVVITWPGGSKAWGKADWSPVFGREKILIDPDADSPGVIAGEGLGKYLADKVKEIKLIDTAGMPDGWDLADAGSWDWKAFKEWAVPRASIFPPPVKEVVPVVIEEPEVVKEEPVVVHKEPEIVQEEPVNVIDQSRNLTINVQAGESDPAPSASIRQKWAKYGLALTDALLPVCNLSNVVKILQKDSRSENTIWYDDFHKRFFWTDKDGKQIEWRDVDTFNLTTYIQEEIGLRRISDDIVYKAVVSFGYEKIRNEPVEWLKSLEWDKHPRLDRFFVDFMGAEDNDYIRCASKNFWISMVARVLRPGCKVDNMIILEGKQGKFKSMALHAIGGKFYTECHESVMNKDFYMILQGKFLIEISELDAFSRAESNTIKKVVTNQTDRFRVPYGRTAQDHPRQCVFVGTTNETLYLRDSTGGRRFWPVSIGNINVNKILDARKELFAEAVHRYLSDEDWYWMPEKQTEEIQESRRQHDEWEDTIEMYVKDKPQVILRDIALNALHIELAKLDIGTQRRIGRILTSLWYVKKNYRSGDDVVKGWVKVEPPEDIW